MSSSALATERPAETMLHPATRRLIVEPSDHDLTVIIPAFNEERRLPTTLDQLTAYLDRWGVDYRVLVADDGSCDGTATLTDGRGLRCSTVRLGTQGGKGRAVRTAMLQATGRVVAFTDADLPFDLAALRRGYEAIRSEQCEVVFGARDLQESAHVAHRRLSRYVATLVFREVVRWLVSRQVTDTQCGLKLFGRPAALEIFSRTTIDGFAFDAEVVMLTHHLGLRFQRIPVTLLNDYASTLSVWRSAVPMLRDVVRLSLQRRFVGGWPQTRIVYRGGAEEPDARPLKEAA
jgi:dolichyl-phosphate beta-glucosyltransferase